MSSLKSNVNRIETKKYWQYGAIVKLLEDLLDLSDFLEFYPQRHNQLIFNYICRVFCFCSEQMQSNGHRFQTILKVYPITRLQFLYVRN